MRRAIAVILVVCCVLSGTTIAASPPEHAAVGGVRPMANATASLTIAPSAVETAAYRHVTLDVSGALALNSQRLDDRFEQRILDERIGRINSTSARRAQIHRTADRIEAAVIDLRERQTEVIRRYNNGSLSPDAFVFALARIDVKAAGLAIAAERVAERARAIPSIRINGQYANNWARNRRIELGALGGPVRDHIRETFQGENTMHIEAAATGLDAIGQIQDVRLEPLQLYVETSDSGVVLAAVDDGIYYREAYLPGVRNTSVGGKLTSIGDAFRRMNQRYPWASNHSSTKRLVGGRRAGIYRFTLFHDHGRLTTYLNRTSGQVFAEQQRVKLSRIPTAAPVTERTNNLTLQVNRTHPTGPLEISLSNADGEPVDGQITVANQSVGRTGSDGNLWTITPRGTYTVVASTDNHSIRVKTTATPTMIRTPTTNTTASIVTVRGRRLK